MNFLDVFHGKTNTQSEDIKLNQSTKGLSNTGMAVAWIIEIVLVFGFFTAIGRDWIMWIAGPAITFFGVWNWVQFWVGSKLLFIRIFHFAVWLIIVVLVLQAAVSYGLSQAEVSIGGSYIDVKSYVTQLITDQKTAQDSLTTLINRQSTEEGLKNRGQTAQDIQSLKDTIAQIDKKLAPYVQKSANGEAAIILNAQTVFKQLYGDSNYRTAIAIFFLLFGFVMEVTLSLAAFYSFYKDPQSALIPEEPKEAQIEAPKASKTEIKPKRKYTRKPKVEPIVEANVSEEVKNNSIDPLVKLQETLEPSDSELTARFIKELFNNGTRAFLKDMKEAADLAGVPLIKAGIIFNKLSTERYNGNLLIEFRASTQKWYPNVTSEFALSYFKDNVGEV